MMIPVVSLFVPDCHEKPLSGSVSPPIQFALLLVGLSGKLIDGYYGERTVERQAMDLVDIKTHVSVQEPQTVVEEEAFAFSESSDDREHDDLAVLDIRMHEHFLQRSIVNDNIVVLVGVEQADCFSVGMIVIL
jgi:hypothetical protein